MGTGLLPLGAPERGIINSAASTEIARYYGLPVEASGLDTNQHVPSIQAGCERGMGGFLPALSWPDVLVGPGRLGGSMILSQIQLMIDVEMFRMFKQARQGIVTGQDMWLDNLNEQVGHGGNFLGERSTRTGIRYGEWHLREIGLHEPYETWEAAGKPTLKEEINERIDELLATHQPLPLGEDVEQELAAFHNRALELESN